eukprot:CAMPEP_0196663674 /NCGR_PEP_ID=MMETSP1086-20130531/53756_1 /TAXON_ID=77921 /ORGANISM="Cyanoptyche  gloeocystis , Strain SAG4.97" /LENGTH=32 /DNA_ID= /DNA_START= /DNA_END= /DNA_ORIENTATION=
MAIGRISGGPMIGITVDVQRSRVEGDGTVRAM